MNANVKRKWINALRNGNYKKCRYCLHDDDEYCCLGVLTQLYLEEHNLTWERRKPEDPYYFGNAETALPDLVQEWAGLSENDPIVSIEHEDYAAAWEDTKVCLSTLNDGTSKTDGDGVVHPYTFREIADFIERQL